MFSGIVEEMAIVTDVKKCASGVKLYIKAKEIARHAKIGDSISVNGACLSVAAIEGDIMQFDIMKETLDATTFSVARRGEAANIERSLKAGDRISGHFVTGHIDCTGIVNSVKKAPNDYKIEIKIPCDKSVYLAPKGSISVDGVSLTIMENGKDYFTISLIPLTLKNTSLGAKKSGDRVNIEFDILAKYAISRSGNGAGRVDAEFLKRHGFV